LQLGALSKASKREGILGSVTQCFTSTPVLTYGTMNEIWLSIFLIE